MVTSNNAFLLLVAFTCLSYAASDSIYDTFVQCLSTNSDPKDQTISSVVYSPTDASFATVLKAYIKNRRFNTSTTPKPAIIVTPKTETHVQAAVVCAKSGGVQIKIRSGGHDYEGLSYVSGDTFIILDMFNLRSITVDVPAETAFVQSGAILGELYYRIWENSKVHAFPAGVCPTVGVGGHLSGGGYGNLLRKFGLSVDNVIDAQIVDAKGQILDRKSMGEDLFWAIRGGGGGSFGVILSYTVKLVKVPEVVTVFTVKKMRDENATDVVYKFQHVSPEIDNDLFIRMLLQPVSGSVKGQKTIRATFIGEYLGNAQSLLTMVNAQFPELGLKREDCFEMSWIDSVLYWGNFDNTTKPEVLLERNNDGVNFLKRKSDYILSPISKDGLEGIFDKMIELGKVGFVFNTYGGRMAEISEGETPFPHRAGNLFKIQYSVNWQDSDPKLANDYLNQAKSLYSYMTPFVSKSPRGAFLNYRDLDIGVRSNAKDGYSEGEVYGMKYFMGNFDRLVKVKTAVDPDDFFRNEQSIPIRSSQEANVQSNSGKRSIPFTHTIRKIFKTKN